MSLTLRLLPTSWRGHYPHMAAGDRPIWERYLDDHAREWDHFAYDVAVGGLDPPPTVTDEAIRRAWRWNTAKRIDALGFNDGAIGIFEVRPYAQVSALGAVLAYSVLLRAELTDVRPHRLYIVTDSIPADIQFAAEHYGVTVLEFPGV